MVGLVSDYRAAVYLAGDAQTLKNYVVEVTQHIVLKLEFELPYFPIPNLELKKKAYFFYLAPRQGGLTCAHL